jgi:hypothetical protein
MRILPKRKYRVVPFTRIEYISGRQEGYTIESKRFFFWTRHWIYDMFGCVAHYFTKDKARAEDHVRYLEGLE